MEPNTIFSEIDVLVPALEKSIGKKGAKSDGSAAAPDERALELIKSAIRVVVLVNGIPDIKASRPWQEFLARIAASSSAAAELLSSMSSERQGVECL